MVNIDYQYSHANPFTNTEAQSFLACRFFFQFWAFQIGKISMVNPLIGKFVIVHNNGIFRQFKKK